MPTKGPRKFRYKITVNGKRIPRSHYIWNLNHPEDPVLPGEIVHHKDHNCQNDNISNLQKRTDAEHRSAEMREVREKNGLIPTTKESCKRGYQKRQEYYVTHPEEYEILKEKQRQGTVIANRLRKGEKKSEEWKKQQSQRLKEQWKNGKRDNTKIFGRRSMPSEGNSTG